MANWVWACLYLLSITPLSCHENYTVENYKSPEEIHQVNPKAQQLGNGTVDGEGVTVHYKLFADLDDLCPDKPQKCADTFVLIKLAAIVDAFRTESTSNPASDNHSGSEPDKLTFHEHPDRSEPATSLHNEQNYQKDVERLTNDLQELQQKHTLSISENERLQNELSQIKSDYESRVSELQKQLSELQQPVQKPDTELQLKSDNSSSPASLQETFNRAEKEHDEHVQRLHEEISELKQSRDQSNSEIDKLQASLDRLQTELTQMEGINVDLEKRLATHSESTDTKSEELRELQERSDQQIETLRKQIASLETERVQHTSEIDKLTKGTTDLEKDYEEYRQKNSHLQSELRESLAQIDELRSQLSTKEKRYTDVLTQLTAEQSRVQRLNDDVRTTKEALLVLQNHQKLNQQSQADLVAVSKRLQTVEKDGIKLKQRHAILHSDLVATKQKLQLEVDYVAEFFSLIHREIARVDSNVYIKCIYIGAFRMGNNWLAGTIEVVEQCKSELIDGDVNVASSDSWHNFNKCIRKTVDELSRKNVHRGYVPTKIKPCDYLVEHTEMKYWLENVIFHFKELHSVTSTMWILQAANEESCASRDRRLYRLECLICTWRGQRNSIFSAFIKAGIESAQRYDELKRIVDIGNDLEKWKKECLSYFSRNQ